MFEIKEMIRAYKVKNSKLLEEFNSEKDVNKRLYLLGQTTMLDKVLEDLEKIILKD